MGKIRVKTLGDEELEKEQKKKTEKRAETKKAKEKEAEQAEVAEGAQIEQKEPEKKEKAKKSSYVKKKTKNPHSKRYQTTVTFVDRNKQYSLSQALELLEKLEKAKFDETVELHVNTIEPGVSASMKLPHGSGKQTRVAIADSTSVEGIVKQVEGGKIDFDVLLATPDVMPKLARVAKYLGPRGLMPNPKNETITAKPQEVAKQYQGGQITVKTEAKSPIIHLSVGKMSFGKEKLSENIKVVFAALPQTKLKNVTLKSTMSPGIKIQI